MNEISIKIPTVFATEVEKKSKFLWKKKKNHSRSNTEQKDHSGGVVMAKLKFPYTVTEEQRRTCTDTHIVNKTKGSGIH